MAFSSVFSIKKPLQEKQNYLPGQAVQKVAPGYKSVISTPTTTAKPKVDTSSFMNRFKVPDKVQGSGMTEGYASNPTNYISTVKPPTTKTPTLPSATETRFADTLSNANNMKSLANKQLENKNKFIKEKALLANKQLQESLPRAKETFNQFKTNTEATIADLLAGGERQKEQASDYYGDAQRQSAMADRQIRGETQKTFAGLNTLDSRGEGSFGQATENQQSDFIRSTQTLLKEKANKLAEIDTNVKTAERQARQTIVTEEAKLSDLAVQIEYALQANNLQEAEDLTNAYNETQQYIYDIEDSLSQAKYALDLEKEKLQNEIEKTNADVAGLSESFLQTGVPQNQADFIYRLKNPDAVAKIGGGTNSGKQEVVSAIQDLLNSGNLSSVTGYGSYNPLNYLPESEAGATRAKLDRVKALVSLENASKLKGTGAISDAERALLAAASSAINGNMSAKQVEDELNRILQQFGGSSAQSNSGTIRVRDNATGQTGTIPASEFDPSQYTRI